MENAGKFLWIIMLMALVALPIRVDATPYTLVNNNSIVELDTESPDGMYTWEVNGKDHLAQQWFWYRVGSTGGEQSLDKLEIKSEERTTTSVSDSLAVVYTDSLTAPKFEIAISYSLMGGPAGCASSDIGEQIRIINKSSTTPLNIHFFQYTDFDLNETPNNDVAMRTGTENNTIEQVEAGPPTGMTFSETIATTNGLNHYQIDTYPNILGALEDAMPTNLLDTTNSPDTGSNVTFAWQWDYTIAAGMSRTISKNKALAATPEPCTMLLFCLGFMGLGVAGIKRRKLEM